MSYSIARHAALPALVACVVAGAACGADDKKPPTRIEFYAAFDAPSEGLIKKQVVDKRRDADRKTVYLVSEPALTNSDVQDVKADLDFLGRPCVSLKLTRLGGEKMRKFSEQQLDHFMAIVVNDEVIFSARVLSIMSRDVEITGEFTDDCVKRLVAKLERTPRISD